MQETAEEEEKTEDECIIAGDFGCDEAIEIPSDTDDKGPCLMSPPKQNQGLNEQSAISKKKSRGT